MLNWLFWLMLAFALVDWIGSWRGWRRIRWVTKPGTLALLIAWFSLVGGWRGPLVWFGLGLVFSLAGDVLLHLHPRYFMLGVAAFILTHIFYIVGFTRQPILPRLEFVIPVMIIGAIFIALNRHIRVGLLKRGDAKLVAPVMVYAVILSLMWLAALSTLLHPGWSPTPAILVSLGAGLFFLSDSFLAYTRFVRSLPNSDLMVMITYHAGQILLAYGVLLQYWILSNFL